MRLKEYVATSIPSPNVCFDGVDNVIVYVSFWLRIDRAAAGNTWTKDCNDRKNTESSNKALLILEGADEERGSCAFMDTFHVSNKILSAAITLRVSGRRSPPPEWSICFRRRRNWGNSRLN